MKRLNLKPTIYNFLHTGEIMKQIEPDLELLESDPETAMEAWEKAMMLSNKPPVEFTQTIINVYQPLWNTMREQISVN